MWNRLSDFKNPYFDAPHGYIKEHFGFLKHNFYIEGFETEVVGWLEYLQRSVVNIIVTLLMMLKLLYQTIIIESF